MMLCRCLPSALMLLATAAVVLPAAPGLAQPATVVDLAAFPPAPRLLTRVYGATGEGRLGVPVAGGHDLDGDGFRDLAVAYFTADPLDRFDAGEVDVVFGDGTIGGEIDTAVDDPRLLRIFGAGRREVAGNEIWMDDVTGDGLGDLLIGRQNFLLLPSRIGAGALTIVVGSPELRRLAADLAPLDLADPPAGVTLVTFVGAAELDRLGIWMRTGDVTGDGVADVVVGADQEDAPEEPNRGAVYLIRGGAHLAGAGVVDLADFGATALAGHLARVTPPPGSGRYHLGSTCQLADLDGNGRAEVLASAALARSGASVHALGAPPGSAEPRGGSPRGSVYVLWDDNFPAGEWTPGYTVDLAAPPGARTAIHGGEHNLTFGEEVLGGRDYDGDGTADLLVGDFLGTAEGIDDREDPGVGYLFFDAATLRDREFDLDDVPASLAVTTIVGPTSNSLGADTAADGDFDGDGVADLVLAAPYATPQGRVRAGTAHVLFGRAGWPPRVDLAPGHQPLPDELRVTEVRAARGTVETDGATDAGDTLGYSATAADHDGDGRTDLIINEMQGNGVAPAAVDVGNLLVVGAAAVAPGCTPSSSVLCLQDGRFRLAIEWRDFRGASGPGRVVLGSDDSGIFWFFNADNWEVLVKVLDGCRINGRFWVFAAATTDVEYTLTVTDTQANESRAYVNPLGVAAPAITDTGAFATCP